MRWGPAAAVAAAAVLAACATPGAGPSLAGRLSLHVAATATESAKGFSAAFDLRGGAEAGELRLSTPLGPQFAAARWRPGEARLATGDGERVYPSLDALANDALGEPVPLQALPDWLRGRPWPAAAAETTADGFAQLGWAIDLSRRAEGLIIAVRAQPPVVTLRLRLDPT